METNNNELVISFKWKLNEYNIFDYSSTDFLLSKEIKKDFKDEPFYCLESCGNINNEKDNITLSKYNKILFRVMKSKTNNIYKIINPVCIDMELNPYNISSLNDRMWLTLKSENKELKHENGNEEYNLLKHDIIKIANKKYEIIEKNIAIKGNEKINKINLKNNTKSIFDISLKYKEYMIKEDLISSCRKCQHNNCDKSNPLLKLCKCGYIHYNCLKSDLKKKIIKPKNEKQTITEYWYKCKEFKCDNCPLYYPFKFQIEDKIYYLIDDLVPKTYINYIILESLNFPEDDDIKNIYVINLNDNNVKIGRDEKNNDIIIREKSISKFHAEIKFNKNNGDVTIINKGKYGTFVLIKDNITLYENDKIYFQVGKVFIKAENTFNNSKENEKSS